MYLQARSSKLINFSINLPDYPIEVYLNRQLYSWTIENLVKNAIDAMRGKGNLHISLTEDTKESISRLKIPVKGSQKANFLKYSNLDTPLRAEDGDWDYR
ncbi:hypothetical protein [Aquimarina hainanensis]|uniref:hypothetical protein n=1 Tax=Aquimarina hainanensis TaxID=1578017 RepID=UPI00360A33C3